MSTFEVINCPACAAEVRVPEQLYGEPVTCPQCSVTFRAPMFEHGVATTKALVLKSPAVVFAASESKRAINANRSVGLVMILVGTISFLVNGVSLVMMLSNPEQTKEQFTTQLMDLTANGDRVQVRAEVEKSWEIIVAGNGLFTGVAAVILLGGVMIMLRRFYSFAMLSAIIAIFNISNCCCIIGLPVGVWTLIVLLSPDVRALYNNPAPPSSTPTMDQ